MEAEIIVPDEVPVMTLPNVAFFPQALMPLHIFEPRYRHMLRDVLASNRIFAIAGLDLGQLGQSENPEPQHRIAGLERHPAHPAVDRSGDHVAVADAGLAFLRNADGEWCARHEAGFDFHRLRFQAQPDRGDQPEADQPRHGAPQHAFRGDALMPSQGGVSESGRAMMGKQERTATGDVRAIVPVRRTLADGRCHANAGLGDSTSAAGRVAVRAHLKYAWPPILPSTSNAERSTSGGRSGMP